MEPGYAELAFNERPSQPVLRFLADKTERGAWHTCPLTRQSPLRPSSTSSRAGPARRSSAYAPSGTRRQEERSVERGTQG